MNNNKVVHIRPPNLAELRQVLARDADPETAWFCELYDHVAEGYKNGWIEEKDLDPFVQLLLKRGDS